jgi:uncharacterized protein (TIGR00106 family)
MAIMEITVVPLGTSTTSFSHFVAEMQRCLEKTGVAFELTDMGTIIEGEMTQLLDTLKVLHEIPFEMGEKRVYTIAKIDDRRDKKTSLGDKIRSVQDRITRA